MELIFTKGRGKFDQLQIRRSDGALETIECPKQGIIPHDMVHYAVEHTLQTSGFLARVQDGEAASFRMQPQAQSDAVERLVEVIQGDAWSGSHSSAADLLDLYRVTCEARGCPQWPITESGLAAVRSAMTDLSTRWAAVAVGDSLRLTM